MSLFLDKEAYLERFKRDKVPDGDQYECTLLRWLGADNNTTVRNNFTRALEITDFAAAPLNIIIAPLDTSNADELAGLEALVRRYDIPGAFLDERTQGVLNSFGYRPHSSTSFCTWIHFLLKDVERSESPPPSDVDPANTSFRRRLTKLLRRPKSNVSTQGESHELEPRLAYIPHYRDDRTCTSYSPSNCCEREEPSLPKWTNRSFFLHVTNHHVDSPEITLICFNPSPFLTDDLTHLAARTNCSQILLNPYILLEIVSYDLYMQLDTTLWELRRIFQVE